MSERNQWWKHEHKKLEIYHCVRCNYWHLTSQIEKEEEN